jgi:hypothetical protein
MAQLFSRRISYPVPLKNAILLDLKNKNKKLIHIFIDSLKQVER